MPQGFEKEISDIAEKKGGKLVLSKEHRNIRGGFVLSLIHILAIIGAVFANGYVKNKVMEFVGPGVAELSADFRIGIDVMTTETTCLSSIWTTDDTIKDFYEVHGRAGEYKELSPGAVTVSYTHLKSRPGECAQ